MSHLHAPQKLWKIITLVPCRNFNVTSKSEIGDHQGNDGVLPTAVYRDSPAWDIKKFLEEVGTGAREARFWLKIFQYRDANPTQPFAVMQVCQSTFKRPHVLSKLGSSLAFLQRNGLKSVIVHGLHERDEDRDMDSGRKRLMEQGLQLADVLESQGAKTTPYINCNGIFNLVMSEKDFYAIRCNSEPIEWSLGNGYIPVVSSVAQFNDKTVHVCPIQASDDLSVHMKPLKVMYLNSSGGLLNEWGKVIEQINIPLEQKDLTADWCTPRIQLKVQHIARLLQKLPLTASAVITSADTILKELFTHRGSGTIFKKKELTCVHRCFETINSRRLLDLLERTFKRKLKEDYLVALEKKLDSAYITESYSAAAIITREPELDYVPYLDKFVVVKENQGLGSGEILWDRIKEDYPQLFWRSRGSNRINPWYFARAEGSWTNGNYTVFWYGVHDPKVSHKMIDFAINHPSTFDDIWIGKDGAVNYDGALVSTK